MSCATPYEDHRNRVRWMEGLVALRHDVTVEDARGRVARATKLSTDQLLNIRKGKLKDLVDRTKAQIDGAFVRLIQRQIGDLEHELEMARASARRVDPRLVEEAQASIDALVALIEEARRAETVRPDEAGGGGEL